MKKSALHFLPVDWQAWVNDNVASGCSPDSMVAEMVGNGNFDRNLAEYAIADAHIARDPTMFKQKLLPAIDTMCNTIRAADRDIQVLLSMCAPRIVLLGNVLSHSECEAMIACSNSRFSPSTLVGQSDGSHANQDFRTSQSATIYKDESKLIAGIDARLAALTNWPVECGEQLQLQKYAKGNQYRPHFDWFDPNTDITRQQMEPSGQRLATIILYLTDVEEGGGTSFPCIGLEVYPKKGNALFFMNTNPYGVEDRKTLHAGLPVEKGHKIIANKWLRERPF